MESALLGLVVDSSVIIEAEGNKHAVEDFLVDVRDRFGKVETYALDHSTFILVPIEM